MNEGEIVENMITFIMNKEKELQADRFASDNKIKKDAVQAILDELDREVTDEDK